MDAEADREWLTVRQAAVRLGVDVDTLRLWIRKGAIRYYRVGPYGTIRIHQADATPRGAGPPDSEPPPGRRGRE